MSFLSQVRGRADELFLEAFGRRATPGDDYCLTEVVHCKSRDEIGVGDAVSTCSARYLNRILALSTASVVVVLGARAAAVMRAHVRLEKADTPDYAVVDADLAGTPRLILFFPHPSSFKPRKLGQVSAPDRARLREALTRIS